MLPRLSIGCVLAPANAHVHEVHDNLTPGSFHPVGPSIWMTCGIVDDTGEISAFVHIVYVVPQSNSSRSLGSLA